MIDEIERLLSVESLPERMCTSQPVQIHDETRKSMSRLGCRPPPFGHFDKREAALPVLPFPSSDCGYVLGPDEHDAIGECMQRANEAPAGAWFRAPAGLARIGKHEESFARCSHDGARGRHD